MTALPAFVLVLALGVKAPRAPRVCAGVCASAPALAEGGGVNSKLAEATAAAVDSWAGACAEELRCCCMEC